MFLVKFSKTTIRYGWTEWHKMTLNCFSDVKCSNACPPGAPGHPGLPGMKVSFPVDSISKGTDINQHIVKCNGY